jgi:hypothetical protein
MRSLSSVDGYLAGAPASSTCSSLPGLKRTALPGDADLGAGAGIAADAGLAGADAEDAKAAQLDAFAIRQSLLEALEDRIHRSLRLGAGKTCALDHMMDDVLLNQRGTSLAQLYRLYYDLR